MDALSVLQKLGTKRFIDELAEQLAEVGTEVAQTRKKGKVTVTFTLSPGADDGVSLVVSEEIKRTPPVKGARGAYFFAVDGELHDADPRQPQMEFREVNRITGEVITVDGNSTVISVKDAG
jgi:hypothetical protein